MTLTDRANSEGESENGKLGKFGECHPFCAGKCESFCVAAVAKQCRATAVTISASFGRLSIFCHSPRRNWAALPALTHDTVTHMPGSGSELCPSMRWGKNKQDMTERIAVAVAGEGVVNTVCRLRAHCQKCTRMRMWMRVRTCWDCHCRDCDAGRDGNCDGDGDCDQRQMSQSKLN